MLRKMLAIEGGGDRAREWKFFGDTCDSHRLIPGTRPGRELATKKHKISE